MLLILGIAAAVTAPALPQLREDNPAQKVAGEILVTLRSARRAALERRQTVTFTFDPETGRYWVDAEDAANPSLLAEGIVRLADAVVTADPARAHFLFDPGGAASGEPLVIRAPSGGAIVGVSRWTGDPFAEAR